jgi:hypothetical protein
MYSSFLIRIVLRMQANNLISLDFQMILYLRNISIAT